MAIPRSQLIDAENPGCYHLFSRCVRRAWLCGEDPVSGRSYEHRRRWIEDRLTFLCQHFAVALYAYAIMNNHYHMVVRLDPKAPNRWSDREVARRWTALFPTRARTAPHDVESARIESICADEAALAEYRSRLGSLSWLMRLLNEPIARRANREDACTGHFWEGRFESRALLDDAAWLSATAYVDLNPFRAGLTLDPLTAAHTSIRLRRDSQLAAVDQQESLPPVVSGLMEPAPRLPLGLSDYCSLLRWSVDATPDALPPLPVALRGGTEVWKRRLACQARHDLRAIGDLNALAAYVTRIGQRWIRGLREARHIATLLGSR